MNLCWRVKLNLKSLFGSLVSDAFKVFFFWKWTLWKWTLHIIPYCSSAGLLPQPSPLGLWPAEPIIRLGCSELCGSPSRAQKSVVKQKHWIVYGFRVSLSLFVAGNCGKVSGRIQVNRIKNPVEEGYCVSPPRVIRTICPPSYTLNREACLTGLNFIEYNFNGRPYYTI